MTDRTTGRRNRNWIFLVVGLLVSLVLAGVVSNFASPNPDGLDAATRAGCVFDADDQIVSGHCAAQAAGEHEVGGPLADYGVAGVGNSFLSTGLAGVIGVLVMFGLAAGLFWLVRGRGRGDEADQAVSAPSAE